MWTARAVRDTRDRRRHGVVVRHLRTTPSPRWWRSASDAALLAIGTVHKAVVGDTGWLGCSLRERRQIDLHQLDRRIKRLLVSRKTLIPDFAPAFDDSSVGEALNLIGPRQ